jgi:hypothetical protein
MLGGVVVHFAKQHDAVASHRLSQCGGIRVDRHRRRGGDAEPRDEWKCVADIGEPANQAPIVQLRLLPARLGALHAWHLNESRSVLWMRIRRAVPRDH